MLSQDLLPPSVAFIFFHQDLVLMRGRLDHCAKPSSERSEMCGGQSMRENDVSCSLNHSQNLNPMNPGIVILKYARDISHEKNQLMEEPGNLVYSGSVCSALLNLDLSNCSNPRSQAHTVGTWNYGCLI